MRRWTLALLPLLLFACEEEEPVEDGPRQKDTTETAPTGTSPPTGTSTFTTPTGTTGTTSTTPTTTTCLHPVNDPGLNPTPSDWESPIGNISPDLAFPVGIVAGPGQAPNYIGTTLPGTEEFAYWVFQAGADFDLNLRVQNAANDFEWMHLYEAPDLCMGDQVDPLAENIGSWFIESLFPVEQDMYYVLEVHVPGAGFF